MAYDANGNVLGLKRTDKTGYMVDHLSLTYKSGTNQLMSVSDAAGANKLQGWDAGSSTNQYDLNGNLISGDGATNIVYDVRNLPIRMQKGGQTIIYRYNAAGQRIYKKVIGTTITEEHYVMNGSELVAVLKNGVVDYWKTSYGRYERSNGTFRAKYYLTDHLGSTRVVLDESGQRVEAYDYYAFGLVLPGRGFGNTTKEKFTGKERDSETGWDYFGARYYNPTIARWMNVDPLADKYPSWSPYNYVMNSPMMAIDPDGKAPDDPNPFRLLRDLARTFIGQSTRQFISAAGRNGFWAEYRNGRTGCAMCRLGRIYEGGVVESLGEKKNNRTLTPAGSRRGVIPDIVDSVRYQGIDAVNPQSGPRVMTFEKATMTEVKFKGHVYLNDSNNPQQLPLMIDYLSEVRGGTDSNGHRHNQKASDYGVASLIIITPSGGVIDSSVIEYATQKRVQIIHRTTQADESDSSRIRVAPNMILLNDVNPINSSVDTMELNTSQTIPSSAGQSAVVNWRQDR